MDWMLLPLKRYATFSGRSRPREYWLFWLFIALATIVLSIVEVLLGIGTGQTVRSVTDYSYGYASYHDMGWLTGLFGLAMFIPHFAVAVRRLHDTDRSGWWLLIGLVPVIGVVVLFVLLVMGGTRGPNRFGPDPVEPPPIA